MKRYAKLLFSTLAVLVAVSFCFTLVLVTTGSGLTLLYFQEEERPPTAAPITTLMPLALMRGTATPAASPSPTVALLIDDDVAALESAEQAAATEPPPTEPPPETDTPAPTETPPPTETLLPTDPPAPTEAPPPTETPSPTDTPAPSYGFALIEKDEFPTGKADLDVFIAVTNDDNRPVSGYRVIATHSDGTQIESGASAGDWTENSGAMHYKAGNIKLHVLNSPGGTWTLQLVDDGGQPAAAPVVLPFDDFNPAWYFVLYQEVD